MDGYKIKTSAFLKHVKDSGGILLIVAKHLGVERQSLYLWLNKNPTFWQYVQQERQKITDIAESKLISKLNDGEVWAIKYVLGSHVIGKSRGYSLTDTPEKFGIDPIQNYTFEIIEPAAKEDDL
jgi:hypothetical protein